jgi:predicted RND superfamily exporter protein
MLSSFKSLYNFLVLRQPLATLIALTLVVVYFLLYIPQFELDASADSLVLENDSSLKYYRAIRERYGSDDFLIVTYSPEKDLFSSDVLADIKRLREELTQLEQIDSVISLLDVPLVESPPMTLAEISLQVRTLEGVTTKYSTIELSGISLAYQFERPDYFISDYDSTSEQPIFNRTMTLRDSWAKIGQSG